MLLPKISERLKAMIKRLTLLLDSIHCPYLVARVEILTRSTFVDPLTCHLASHCSFSAHYYRRAQIFNSLDLDFLSLMVLIRNYCCLRPKADANNIGLNPCTLFYILKLLY